MKLDLSFAQAARIVPKEFDRLKMIQIGAGGTGSFAAMNLARIAYELELRGKKTELTIIDPDIVEADNIPRSNFCTAEIGRFKAQTLAERIALAWGIEVGCVNAKFVAGSVVEPQQYRYRDLVVLIGCVDNYLARREIHNALSLFNDCAGVPHAWWIDGGNGRNSGQVLIGSETEPLIQDDSPSSALICQKLPAPSLIHPELLEPEILDPKTTSKLTCPQRIRQGTQSLHINQRVAIEIAQMLTELVLTQSLKRYATYFDLESGTTRSEYVPQPAHHIFPTSGELPRPN